VVLHLDKSGGLQSLDGIATGFVLPDVVPEPGVIQGVLKYRQHVLAEADSPALVVNRGHCGAGSQAFIELRLPSQRYMN
jgi:hypothetical protein